MADEKKLDDKKLDKVSGGTGFQEAPAPPPPDSPSGGGTGSGQTEQSPDGDKKSNFGD